MSLGEKRWNQYWNIFFYLMFGDSIKFKEILSIIHQKYSYLWIFHEYFLSVDINHCTSGAGNQPRLVATKHMAAVMFEVANSTDNSWNIKNNDTKRQKAEESNRCKYWNIDIFYNWHCIITKNRYVNKGHCEKEKFSHDHATRLTWKLIKSF